MAITWNSDDQKPQRPRPPCFYQPQGMRQEVGIEYRRARPEDLPQAASVFAIAIDDLNKKHGFFEEPTSTSPPNPQYAFWLRKEPASFWVAENDHTKVGYTIKFLRVSLQFL